MIADNATHLSRPTWYRQLLYAAALFTFTAAWRNVSAQAPADVVGLAVGTAAPGAAVESLDGKATDLGTYVGKGPVVLEFWATWCPLCKKLEPALQAARAKYAGKVTFVSVGVNNNQTAEQETKYVASNKLTGEYVFDKDGKAVAAYKAPHTSYLVVVDGGGKIVYTGVGSDQNVEAAVAKAMMMSPNKP